MFTNPRKNLFFASKLTPLESCVTRLNYDVRKMLMPQVNVALCPAWLIREKAPPEIKLLPRRKKTGNWKQTRKKREN